MHYNNRILVADLSDWHAFLCDVLFFFLHNPTLCRWVINYYDVFFTTGKLQVDIAYTIPSVLRRLLPIYGLLRTTNALDLSCHIKWCNPIKDHQATWKAQTVDGVIRLTPFILTRRHHYCALRCMQPHRKSHHRNSYRDIKNPLPACNARLSYPRHGRKKQSPPEERTLPANIGTCSWGGVGWGVVGWGGGNYVALSVATASNEKTFYPPKSGIYAGATS